MNLSNVILSVTLEASRKLSSIFWYFLEIKRPIYYIAANFHSWVLVAANPPPIDLVKLDL